MYYNNSHYSHYFSHSHYENLGETDGFVPLAFAQSKLYFLVWFTGRHFELSLIVLRSFSDIRQLFQIYTLSWHAYLFLLASKFCPLSFHFPVSKGRTNTVEITDPEKHRGTNQNHVRITSITESSRGAAILLPQGRWCKHIG